MTDLPKPIVGEGHPMSPDRGKVLSRDDEKRVDEKGRAVVDGKLWSEAASGIYLVVALHSAVLFADRTFKNLVELDLSSAPAGLARYKLSLMISPGGKPTFNHAVVGACIELPDDLGSDKEKQRYLAEWLVDTVMECFENRGVALAKGEPFTINLMECVAHAADQCIQGLGL